MTKIISLFDQFCPLAPETNQEVYDDVFSLKGRIYDVTYSCAGMNSTSSCASWFGVSALAGEVTETEIHGHLWVRGH